MPTTSARPSSTCASLTTSTRNSSASTTRPGSLTPNEWWQKRTFAFLDFICGLAYTPFFFSSARSAHARSISYIFSGNERRAIRSGLGLHLANVLGFSFYYTYPAAPPWYVAAHGFTADLSVHASAAGALRFDKLVGMPIMENFYNT